MGRRGQAAVEFTPVLPFFVPVLLLTIYLGMFVLDYVTLDNVANSAARYAVAHNGIVSQEVSDKVQNTKLFLTWYKLNFASPQIKETADDTGKYITVLIQAKWNLDNDNIFYGILPKEAYTVSKTARIEN